MTLQSVPGTLNQYCLFMNTCRHVSTHFRQKSGKIKHQPFSVFYVILEERESFIWQTDQETFTIVIQ